jgi:hypothetical protein
MDMGWDDNGIEGLGWIQIGAWERDMGKGGWEGWWEWEEYLASSHFYLEFFILFIYRMDGN